MENIAKVERMLLKQIEDEAALEAKRAMWRAALWKGARVDYWIDALIAENIAGISDITWPLILRMRRNPGYKNLGAVGERRLAELAGLGPRPVWVPGRYDV